MYIYMDIHMDAYWRIWTLINTENGYVWGHRHRGFETQTVCKHIKHTAVAPTWIFCSVNYLARATTFPKLQSNRGICLRHRDRSNKWSAETFEFESPVLVRHWGWRKTSCWVCFRKRSLASRGDRENITSGLGLWLSPLGRMPGHPTYCYTPMFVRLIRSCLEKCVVLFSGGLRPPDPRSQSASGFRHAEVRRPGSVAKQIEDFQRSKAKKQSKEAKKEAKQSKEAKQEAQQRSKTKQRSKAKKQSKEP